MIEIHSHILPGLDDGAPDLAAAQQLARDYIAQGVSDVVCTPHLTTEHSQTPATLDWYLEKRNHIQAQLTAWLEAEKIPLRLHQGAELLISSATLGILQNDTWRDQITLAQSDYILVELPSVLAGGYKALDQILFNIQILGLQPILAHPERAMKNEGFTETLAQWIDAGRVLTQVNNSSFVTDPRLDPAQQQRYHKRQTAIDHLAAQDLIHFTASDAHHPTRRPVQNLLARETLTARYGPQRAAAWTRTNPAKILENEVIP
jgi:protein-tyrosine phosphatase